MAKVHLCINVDPEIRQWFKDHGISPSQFFREAWGQYIDDDIDTKSRIIISRIETIDQERTKLNDELEKCTGQRFEQMKLDVGRGVSLKDKEKTNLQELVDAMPEDHRKVLHGSQVFSGVTINHVSSWIDSRKADFGILLPTATVIKRIRDNGGSEEADVGATADS